MNKKINPILAILILFLVVAAVGVVSWWVAQQEGKQTLSSSPKKQAAQSTPKEDKTKNWQTYHSEKYGFEFRYPGNMNISQEQPNEARINLISNDLYINIYIFDKNGQIIGFNIEEEGSIGTPCPVAFLYQPSVEFMNKEKEIISKKTIGAVSCPNIHGDSCSRSPEGSLCNVEQFGDIKGLVYYAFIMNDSNRKSVIFYNGEKRFLLSVSPNKLEEDILYGSNTYEFVKEASEYLKDFDQILSTFKFIERKNNIFNLNEVKVGDKIAGMTIESSGPFSQKLPFSKENFSIKFSGNVTITGTYHYYGDEEGFFYDTVCFRNLDQLSQLKMPQIKEDDGDVWFCFGNQDFAKSVFIPKGGSGTATIVIDDYNLVHYPAEVWSTAKLIKVINKN